jgi:Emfourin
VPDDRWRIELERSGGFAGVTLHSVADTSDLDPSDADQLRRLASAVDFARYEQGGQGGMPDAFQYHVVADHDGERHDVTVGESAVDPDLHALVDWLMERLRQQR